MAAGVVCPRGISISTLPQVTLREAPQSSKERVLTWSPTARGTTHPRRSSGASESRLGMPVCDHGEWRAASGDRADQGARGPFSAGRVDTRDRYRSPSSPPCGAGVCLRTAELGLGMKGWAGLSWASSIPWGTLDGM